MFAGHFFECIAAHLVLNGLDAAYLSADTGTPIVRSTHGGSSGVRRAAWP
jgi:hypothetical protein